MARLAATRAPPTTTIQTSPVPGPVAARVPGEAVAAAATGLGALDPEADDDAGGAAALGATAGAASDAVVGVLGAGVERGGAVVAADVALGPAVVVGAAGGVVVVGDAAAETTTTVNPATWFPVAWPGAVSLTKVYRGEPL